MVCRIHGRVVPSLLAAVLLLAPAAVGCVEQEYEAAAAEGARLFSGGTRFAKGGPPCASCHDAAGLGLPGGGSVGPDLTGSYAKYGPGPLETVLSTLYFPTMDALFSGRMLTAGERRDLAAFLQRSATLAPRRSSAPALAAAAVIGALVLLAVAWAVWRGRLRGVRRTIVAGAKGRGRS